MIIQYVSDIHLEFLTKLPKIKAIADVLCLAGDIGYPYSGIYKDFLIKMNESFKKVFIITGNHEYYMLGKNGSHTIDEINSKITSLIKEHDLKNITFLNNSYEEYNGYTFVGTTLWSKIPSQNMNDIHIMNDFKQINNMTYDTYNILHKLSNKFIEQTLFSTIDKNKKIIMITHHIPSFTLIDEKFKQSDYNCFYASECEKYFTDNIKAWIYGHTHIASKNSINNIQFVCNPKGYPSENSIIQFETIEV
jgi:Icc-related predicted phosphoesterase